MTDLTATARMVNVTPTLAQEWLKRNKRNRTTSSPYVIRYRNDMAAGRWRFAADPVRFDTNGHLLDGQHRLLALADLPEGTAIPMLVVEGLEAESQLTMDQGRRRSAGAQLGMLGVRDSNTVAAGIRLYLALQTGMLFRDNKLQQAQITTAHIEEWLSLNSELTSAVSELPYLHSSDAPGSIAYCAALLFIPEVGADVTVEFFRLLHAGAGDGHPINTLDKKLQRTRRERKLLSRRDCLALFVKAMNAWQAGRTPQKFQLPLRWTEDTFPKVQVAS